MEPWEPQYRDGRGDYERVPQGWAKKLESDLAAMTAQRDKAIRERGTLLATEQGPTPIGQMLSDMEQRALAAEARALAMEKDAERYRWLRVNPVPCARMADDQTYSRQKNKPEVFDSAIDTEMAVRGEIDASRARACDCRACRPESVEIRMIVCQTCGNKRCPHANDHRYTCTNSNDTGQPGSAYP